MVAQQCLGGGTTVYSTSPITVVFNNELLGAYMYMYSTPEKKKINLYYSSQDTTVMVLRILQ